MRILIINYYYPPLVNAHSYRWAQIAAYWAARGHQVEVISGRLRGVDAQTVESGVDVRRVGMISSSVQPAMHSTRIISWPKRAVEMLRYIYRKLYWPDALWHWIPSLLLEIWRRRRRTYDVVVSYYPCMGAHLAVTFLQGISRQPRFSWLADYGDPFSTSVTMQPNYYNFYSRLNRYIERSILSRVKFMIFTNEATLKAYETSFGQGQKMRIIPHLVDINNLYAGDRRLRADASQDLILYFIGGFHKNIREPTRLFNLIRAINKTPGRPVILNICGPLNGYSPADLSPADCSYIRYLGPVPREQAIDFLKSADAIVNVDNENCDMTPSKIVECISTGRPLLNISHPEAYYVPLQVYEKSGHAISLYKREFSLDDALAVREFLERHAQAESVPRSVVWEAVGSHDLSVIAGEYEDLANMAMSED